MVRAIAFFGRRSIKFLMAVLLIGVLTACGGDRPPQAIIEQAIQLQVEQTQAQLRQQFRNGADLPSAKIDRVKVKKQQSEAIDSQTGYRIEGTYRLSIDLPQHKSARQNPFEVHLQHSSDDTWSLARPLPDDRWEIYPLLQTELIPTPDS